MTSDEREKGKKKTNGREEWMFLFVHDYNSICVWGREVSIVFEKKTTMLIVWTQLLIW